MSNLLSNFNFADNESNENGKTNAEKFLIQRTVSKYFDSFV